jgi:hypothetical protein
MFTNRPLEGAGLLATAVNIGERHQLGDPLARARSNLGEIGKNWDLPEAREHVQAALAACRRRGDRFAEILAAANLMYLDLLAGRWDELEALAAS